MGERQKTAKKYFTQGGALAYTARPAEVPQRALWEKKNEPKPLKNKATYDGLLSRGSQVRLLPGAPFCAALAVSNR